MYLKEWNKIAGEVNFNLDIDIVRAFKEIPVEARVLDFGCGYGRVSKLLHESGYRNLIGVDSSIKMIERGQQEFPELTFQVSSGNVLTFPDNSFDAIIVCAVFTCITSQEARLSQINELYRVLKPGGVLHMVEFCSETSRKLTTSIGVPMLHSSPDELRELVSMLHIINEKTENINTMHGNTASSYRVFARKLLNKAGNPTS